MCVWSRNPDTGEPGWGHSVTVDWDHGNKTVTANVTRFWPDRPNEWGGHGVLERHPILDGVRYATEDAARFEAFTLGVLHIHNLGGQYVATVNRWLERQRAEREA